MKTNTPTQIGMREFMRNTKKIKAAVARGEEFEVLDRTTPVFKIVPTGAVAKKKYSLADLKKLRFRSGQSDLSQSVDEIVYGS